jgi:hypothetical protein
MKKQNSNGRGKLAAKNTPAAQPVRPHSAQVLVHQLAMKLGTSQEDALATVLRTHSWEIDNDGVIVSAGLKGEYDYISIEFGPDGKLMSWKEREHAEISLVQSVRRMGSIILDIGDCTWHPSNFDIWTERVALALEAKAGAQ